jgi:endonuclease-3
VGKKGAVGHRAGLRIGWILREVRRMVYGSTDRRATALSELKRSEGSDPFKILIGTILSHRTRDENTTRAVENLFSRYRDAHELASADIDEVRRLIKPAGFYNMKARNIVLVARQIVDEFGGKVPSDIDSLLSLRSVGRKTANCVLVYGFGIPAIPVDTHVHRISNRLGIVETRTPAETEEALKKVVPKKYWLELNDLFVRFGQTTCRPVGPRCNVCSLAPRCRYYRETYLPSRKDR